MRRTLFVAVSVALASSIAGAQQQRTLTGRVVGEGGSEPLSGATVNVIGTTIGALTSEDGRYRVWGGVGAVVLMVRRMG